MKLWSRTTSMLRNLFRKRQVENQLDDEVHAYVNMLTDERIAAGMSASEARRTAQAEFGGIEQVKQAVRDHRAGTNVELLWQDARFGLRQLRRNPGFTWTAIVTLALSIGANTAIFSIVNALMLKSLPYSQPERMGTIYTRIKGTRASDERHHVNGEQWELLRDNVPALISAVSGIRPSGVNLEAGPHVQYVHNQRISAHYLDVLGIQPAIGRDFSAVEDRPHGPQAAILSDSLWRSLFGADRSIVGRAILLKGAPYTVIGVLPPDATTPSNADIYTALQPAHDGEGGGTNFEAITRLRDGATWQEADAEINRAWSKRANRYELEDDPNAQVSYYSVPLQKGQAATLRPQALTLMLASGFILLIACANLAGLTLVRMMRRTAEVATRLALGASRWQIQRQFWIENLLLALVGGAAGIGMGFLALRGLLVLLPEHFLPVARVSLDGRVLAFTLALSLLTSVLFGMLPGLATRKVDLRSSLASRSLAGTGSQRLRQTLIAGEVALTVVLLAASGLLIRTLIHLETLPPGFNPNGVMTARASLDDVRFHDSVTFERLLDQSTAAMRQIPGVQDAAVGLSLPYERSMIMGGISITDGKESGQKAMADFVYVTPDYFATLQMPIVIGRSFTQADGAKTQHVAIVNQTFVHKYFHGDNPVGRHLNKDTVIGARNRCRCTSNRRGNDVHSRHANRKQPGLDGSCLVPTKLDCPHCGAGRRIDCADATRVGKCWSQPPFLGLLQHARSTGEDAGIAAGRGGAPERNGDSGPAAECGWNLRAGRKYRGAENPRNRHSYRAWFYHSSSHDPYRSAGCASFGIGAYRWFDLVCGSFAGYAQRALWCGRL